MHHIQLCFDLVQLINCTKSKRIKKGFDQVHDKLFPLQQKLLIFLSKDGTLAIENLYHSVTHSQLLQ